MKSLLILAGALLLTASDALAQTVIPPGTVPGAQPVNTPDMSNAGSPRAHARTEKVPNMDRRDQKKLRKMGKVKTNPEGTMKTKAY